MTLWDAPFRRPLKVLDLRGLPSEVRLVLSQLGLDQGEEIEKCHLAPLGDPLSLRIGSQLFTLRAEICRKIEVATL